MTLAVYWLCVAVLLSCNVLVQSELTTLYPTDPQDWSLFPYGAGDVELPDQDQIISPIDGFSHNIIFYGSSFDSVAVGDDGFIYLRVGYDGSNMIAPFYGDVDFSGYTPGFHSYRLDSTPEILARATDAVMAIRQYAQEVPDFQAAWTLIVTWHDAVIYGRTTTERNTFQLVLACDDAHTFAIFNYGNQMDGSGAGTGVMIFPEVGGRYDLPGSWTDAINDIVRNKRLIFRLDPPTFVLPLCTPGSMSESGNAIMGPCSECLVGFYQSTAGSVNCTSCPSGQTTLNTRSDSSEDCYTPGSSVLDPHFMITNPKTGERFCFDYGGKERDVLNLVHDEKAELSISGVLFEVGPTEEKVTYFANIVIGTSAGTRLNFTKYEVIIGDEELSWDMEDIHVGDDIVIRPLHERAQAMMVELDGGDIGVVVTRHHDDIGYYLGVYLSNTEGLSNDSEGLLGQLIHNDFEVDIPNSLVTWHLSRGDIVVPVVQKERFNPAAHDNQVCWVYITEDEDNELFAAAMTHTNTHARNAFIGGV